MMLGHKQFDLYGKKVFEKIVLAPPFRLNDQMENDACFVYMEEGEYVVNASTEQVTLHSREAVLMRCGSYFTEFLKSLTSDKCEAIVVHLYPEILKRIFAHEISNVANALQDSSKRIPVSKYVNDGLFKIYIESLNMYFDNPSLVNDDLIILKLRELIILLTRTENAQSIGQLILSLFSQREYSIREVVEAHLYTEFSLEKLAFLSHLSVSSFKREFTKIYKDSPARYFKNKRIERASELLTATDQRIGDIAFACGFADIAHFSKSFLAHHGVSPSQYRMDHKDKSLT